MENQTHAQNQRVPVIQVSGLKKQYKLGQIGGGTLTHDLQSWWARVRGKEDPNTVIGTDARLFGKTFMALNGVDLTVYKGEALGIIGRNGAGKSTMLNAVAGVWPVDEGKIIIDGVDVTRLSEHQRAAYIGRVFQDPMTGTAATMQIEENLALAARRGKPRTLRIGITKAEREQYRELLKTLDLGLEDRLTARVGLLSGGQRQALTLLMATMNKPKLLLLDEHTAALDPKTALKVLTLSAKIVEENHLTTMMITHNMKDAIKYGNRLIMMYEGHIIYDVSGEEKKNLHVSDLLAKFQIASGGEFANDRMILS